MTEVININTSPRGVKYEYCGRGSIFGNPFEIGRDGERGEVISKYNKWFRFLIKDERFVRELMKLKDKKLGCFCSPEPCHCNIIANYLDSFVHDL